jgi:hypothetical protein
MMKNILGLPHRVCESTCFINGLEDILEWKGSKYTDYLLPVLGGMGGFSYIKVKTASPPNMVYFGANPKYLLSDLENLIGFQQEIIENKVFKNTFPRLKEHLENGNPVVAGAMDMYYLHYYSDIHLKQHIPIHYVLVTGFDDSREEIYVHDCTFDGVQVVSYSDFEKALNVNVPGMSRKNTIRAFIINANLPGEYELAKKGLVFRAEKMLNPPVNLLGLPAMKKLSREVLNWEDEASFDHLMTYSTVPPHIPKNFDNSNGMRLWIVKLLRELGIKYKENGWLKASGLFETSAGLIRELCRAAKLRDRSTISELILKVADIENEAYEILKDGSN